MLSRILLRKKRTSKLFVLTNHRSRCKPATNSEGLSHIDALNKPTMVDVSAKLVTKRIAHAQSSIWLPNEIISLFEEGSKDIQSKKGPVFATAIIAGTMAAKKTSDLIPFCHPIPLESCKLDISLNEKDRNEVIIKATVSCHHKTGVEMEALTACSCCTHNI
eukprot:TRINITY_DN5074_c0_g3_i1.p1 TRINITY_DN5074_c0_g3~~TRINITY_DN5074_c0_g3_i1.p1  ORF type:complete len:162 (-),score=22.91 TRINITY_DN5074_c0_g3_i1:248-733(-)